MTIDPGHCSDCRTASTVACIAYSLTSLAEIEGCTFPGCYPENTRNVLLSAFNRLKQGRCLMAIDKMKEVAASFTV